MERSEWPEDLKRLVAHAEEINWPGTILIGGSRAIPWIEHPRDWDIILISDTDCLELIGNNYCHEYIGLNLHRYNNYSWIHPANFYAIHIYGAPIYVPDPSTIVLDIQQRINQFLQYNDKYTYQIILWICILAHTTPSMKQIQLLNSIHDKGYADLNEWFEIYDLLQEV